MTSVMSGGRGTAHELSSEPAENWRDSANCLGTDPHLFHAVSDWDTVAAIAQADKAKAICRRCDVSGDCLAFALESGDVDGILGGTTPPERRKLGQRRKTGPQPGWTKSRSTS